MKMESAVRWMEAQNPLWKRVVGTRMLSHDSRKIWRFLPPTFPSKMLIFQPTIPWQKREHFWEFEHATLIFFFCKYSSVVNLLAPIRAVRRQSQSRNRQSQIKLSCQEEKDTSARITIKQVYLLLTSRFLWQSTEFLFAKIERLFSYKKCPGPISLESGAPFYTAMCPNDKTGAEVWAA